MFSRETTGTALDLGERSTSPATPAWELLTTANILPTGLNVSGSDSIGVGVLVTRNDVQRRGRAPGSRVVNAVLTADSLALDATENATILARETSVASASGGSLLGKGTVIAVNGSAATNLVLSHASAYVSNSSVTTTGDLSVTAANASQLDATLLSSTSTGDTGVGVALAFNTVGWGAQNLLFNALDALIGRPTTDSDYTSTQVVAELDNKDRVRVANGDVYRYTGDTLTGSIHLADQDYTDTSLWSKVTNPFGNEQPADVLAYVSDSSTDVGGDFTIAATSAALVNATVSNAATSAASALYDATGKVYGGVLASNKVSGSAQAYLASPTAPITVAGDLAVTADDFSGVYANTKFVSTSITTNDGGASLLGAAANNVVPADFRTDEGTVAIKFGQRVRIGAEFAAAQFTTDSGSVLIHAGDRIGLADGYAVPTFTSDAGAKLIRAGDVVALGSDYSPDRGTPGGSYQFIGAWPHGLRIDLSTEDYTDATRWTPVGGNAGSVYRYLGTASTLDLGAVDYSDSTQWAEVSAKAGDVYEYMGTANPSLDLAAQNYADNGYWKLVPETDLIPQGYSLTPSDSQSIGGIVVLNDARGYADAHIDGADVTAASVAVAATEAAVIRATTDSTSSSSGGDVFGKGKSLAVNAVVATNVVLSSADAYINDGAITTTSGDVSVAADNLSLIQAETHAAAVSGANSAAFLLAFNTVGWQASNVLFNTIDAIIGDPLISHALGGEKAARVDAHILNTRVDSAGSVTVAATSEAKISSLVSNDATSAPTAFFGAAGTSVSGVLSSNRVNSTATAYIDYATGYAHDSKLADVTAGGAVSVSASDDNGISASTRMYSEVAPTNDAGAGILNTLAGKLIDDYGYTTRSGVQDVKFGDKVHLADDFLVAGITADGSTQVVTPTPGVLVQLTDDYSGAYGEAGAYYKYLGPANTPINLGIENFADPARWLAEGGTYQFMGTDALGKSLNLGTQDYTDFARWKRLNPRNLISDSVPFTLLSEVGAKFKKEGLTGDSKSYFGLIDFNDARSDVQSYLAHAKVQAVGDVSVVAVEGAAITALEDSYSAPWTGVGGIIATNVVLSKADASISASDVTSSGGGVTVDAANVSLVDATTTSKVEAWDSKTIVVAFNSIGWKTQNLYFNLIDAVLGDPIEASGFNGEEPAEVKAFITGSTIHAATDLTVSAVSAAQLNATVGNENQSEAALDLVFGKSYAASGVAGGGVLVSNKVSSTARAYVETSNLQISGGVSISARDDAGITADSSIIQNAITTNTATAVTDIAKTLLPGDYKYTTLSGTQTVEKSALSLLGASLLAGTRVRVGAGYSIGGDVGAVYEYLGDDATIDLGAENYADASRWKKLVGGADDVADLYPGIGNLTDSDAKAVGILIVVNDVKSDVAAYVLRSTVNASTPKVFTYATGDQPEAVWSGDRIGLDSGDVYEYVGDDPLDAPDLSDASQGYASNPLWRLVGAVELSAIENALISSNALADVTASGGSFYGTGSVLAVNGQAVTNVVLSQANAYVKDSTITTTAGGVGLDAKNTSILDATLTASTSTGDTGVGITLAFNTVGWKTQNLLFNAIDAILGDPLISEAFHGQAPADVQAYILNSAIHAGGDLSLTATNESQINATVSNAATSAASALYDANGKSVGGLVASNKVNSRARAFIDSRDHDHTNQDGTVPLATGDRVKLTVPGTGGVLNFIYEYLGDAASVNLATANYGDSSKWLTRLYPSGMGTIAVVGAVSIHAADNAGIYANTKLVNSSITTNDGGASVLQESLNDFLPADYQSSEGTRTVQFGQRVRVSDDYATPDYDSSATDPTTLVAGNLVKVLPDYTKATFTTASGKRLMRTGDTVMVGDGYAHGGTVGKLYRYIGAAAAGFRLDLGLQNYGDTALWAQIGGTEGTTYRYLGPVADLVLSNVDYSDTSLWKTVAGAGGIFEYMGPTGTVNLGNQDYTDLGYWKPVPATQIIPQGNNVTASDATSVGGIIVVNDVRAVAEAFVLDSTTTAGSVGIAAEETAVIRATADSAVTASGGSAFGEGKVIAVNGTIATNIVLSSASAYVQGGSVATSAGGITIDSANLSQIDATTKSVTSSGDTGVGIALAFNAIGWKPQNILFNTADALLGQIADNYDYTVDQTLTGGLAAGKRVRLVNGDIYQYDGDAITGTVVLSAQDYNDASKWTKSEPVFQGEQPALTLAYIADATIHSAGPLDVTANSEARINATVTNEATSAAVALVDATSKAVGGILASNKVSTASRAYIQYAGSQEGTVVVDGPVTVIATDDASITADTKLAVLSSSKNDGGLGILGKLVTAILSEYQYTSNSGVQAVKNGDLVRVADDHGSATGLPGAIYQFLGTDAQGMSLNLGTANYLDAALWLKLDLSNPLDVIPAQYRPNFTNVTGSDAIAVGGMVVRNDVRGDVAAYASNVALTAGSITIQAVEAATLVALDDSSVISDGGSVFAGGNSIAVNAVIATNNVLSKADAYAVNSTLTTTGGGLVDVEAQNTSSIDATITSDTESRGKSVGVTLAFNTIGWDASNLLYETVDALTGAGLGTERPAEVRAYLDATTVHSTGAITVSAVSDATVAANILTSSTAVLASLGGDSESNVAISIGAVLSMNKVSTLVQATIGHTTSVLADLGDLAVTARDRSVITSAVSAPSLSVAISGEPSTSVSVGLALARNEIHNDMTASVVNVTAATTTLGSVRLTADEAASIDAVSSASSITVSISAGGSKSFGGGGATAVNLISGKANAFFQYGQITASGSADGQGLIVLSATDSSTITASVKAFSVSVGIGGGTTPAASIGFSLARNLIGWDEYGGSNPIEVMAYVQGASLAASRGVSLSSATTSTIHATVEATSVAVAASTGTSVGLSAAGLWTDNKIAARVKSYIDGSVSVVATTGDIVLTASDAATVTADARSASVAGSLSGGSGGAVSIGLSLAFNTIADEVEASLSGVTNATATAGAIRLSATDTAAIDATSAAGSISVSAGGSNGFGFSGGGAVAQNVILTTVNADALSSSLHSAGDIALTALSTATIQAIVAAVSGSLSFGGSNGVAASIGVALARNFIGWDKGTPTSDYTTSSQPQSLVAGNTVRVEDGARAGDVYQYIGPTVTLYQYTTESGSRALVKGDTVKVSNTYSLGGTQGGVYRYLGGSATRNLGTQDYANTSLWEFVGASALGAQDFADVSLWSIVSLTSNPAEVRAYLSGSAVDAGGNLTLVADATETIRTIVLAGSVAVGGGGTAGVAVSGAGAATENRIQTDVMAFIDGSTSIQAASVSLTAHDKPTIQADAGAASIAGAVGGTAGVAASIGLSLALNEVSDQVAAYIRNATTVTTTSGDVTLDAKILGGDVAPALYTTASGTRTLHDGDTVQVATGYQFGGDAGRIYRYRGADEVAYLGLLDYSDTNTWEVADGTIRARSAAASLAASFGGTAGIALSGAGAVATNVILSKVNSYVENSRIVSAGDVDLDSADSSSITAIVAAASVAAGGGGTVGVGASLGASLAWNLIGWKLDGTKVPAEVQSYLLNSSIDATGDLSLSAIADQSIDALVLAGSAAISGGGVVGVGVSGAGVFAQNKISSKVRASIDGDTTLGIAAQGISLDAEDTSTIDATAAAASLAAGFAGTVGVSVSVGASIARNTIANEVVAYVSGASHGVTARSGDLEISAIEDASIDADSVAASLSVAVAGIVGIALGGAGAEATNVVEDSVQAYALNSVLTAQGANDVTIEAESASTITSLVGAVAGAVAGGTVAVAGAVGASIARNLVGYDSVDDTVGGKNLVLAYADGSTLTAGGDVLVSASATDRVATTSFSGSVAIAVGIGAAVAGSGAEATSKIGSKVNAYLSNTSAAAAGDISVLATSDSRVTKSSAIGAALSASLGAASVAVSLVDNLISDDVRAYAIATGGRTIQAGGDIAFVANAAHADLTDVVAVTASVSGGLVGLSGGGIDIRNTIDENVLAYASGPLTISAAGDVSVLASEHAHADADASAVTVSVSLGGALGVALVTNRIQSDLAAYLSGTTVLSTDTTVRADSYSEIPKTLTVGISASAVAAQGNSSIAEIATQTQAYANNAVLLSQGAVTILASAHNTAYSSADGGAFGAIALGAMSSSASIGRGDPVDEVVASVGTSTRVTAESLRVSASSVDDLLATSIAAGAGIIAGTGADSRTHSDNATLAQVGDNARIVVAALTITSSNSQATDAKADSYSLALASGSGAGAGNTNSSKANVSIGSNASVLANSITITAANDLTKDRYANDSNLRSGSASLGSLTVLESDTTIGTASHPFQAVVDINSGANLVVDGNGGDLQAFKIEASTSVHAVDSVRIESVSGFAVTAGLSNVTSRADAAIHVSGATLENKSGDLFLTTRADSHLTASTNLLVLSAVSSGSGSNSTTDSTVNDEIVVANSTLKGSHVNLYAGRDSNGEPNVLLNNADSVITAVSWFPNLVVPVVHSTLRENSVIDVQGTSKLQALKDANLLAVEGVGGSHRAATSGMALSLSLVPYGFDVPDGSSVVTTKTVTIAPTASVEAGLNSSAEVLIRPVTDGGVQVFDPSRFNTALTTAEKTALGIPADARYVYGELDLTQVSFNVTTGMVIQVVAGANGGGVVGAYYQFKPKATADVILEAEDFSNTNRWEMLTTTARAADPTTNTPARPTIADVEASNGFYASDVTKAFATSLAGQFYVVKPATLAAPTVTYRNLGRLLLDQRDKILSWIVSHDSDAEAVARYQVQLSLLDETLGDLGLLETVNDPNSSAAVQLVRKDLDILIINLPDIYSSPGSVFIEADAASQAAITPLLNSALVARGGAKIVIDNQTPLRHAGGGRPGPGQPPRHGRGRQVHGAGAGERLLQQHVPDQRDGGSREVDHDHPARLQPADPLRLRRAECRPRPVRQRRHRQRERQRLDPQLRRQRRRLGRDPGRDRRCPGRPRLHAEHRGLAPHQPRPPPIHQPRHAPRRRRQRRLQPESAGVRLGHQRRRDQPRRGDPHRRVAHPGAGPDRDHGPLPGHQRPGPERRPDRHPARRGELHGGRDHQLRGRQRQRAERDQLRRRRRAGLGLLRRDQAGDRGRRHRAPGRPDRDRGPDPQHRQRDAQGRQRLRRRRHRQPERLQDHPRPDRHVQAPHRRDHDLRHRPAHQDRLRRRRRHDPPDRLHRHPAIGRAGGHRQRRRGQLGRLRAAGRPDRLRGHPARRHPVRAQGRAALRLDRGSVEDRDHRHRVREEQLQPLRRQRPGRPARQGR